MTENRPCEAADLARLSNAPLFTALDPQRRQSLARCAQVMRTRGPTLLFSHGDPADAFYGVLEGQVRLTTLTAEGAESVIALIEPGDTFAEAAIVGACRFPVAAQAEAGSLLVRVDGAGFLRLLRDDPGLLRGLLAGLIRRQTDLVHEIHFLKSTSPAQRLASYLLSLLESGAWPGHGRLPVAKHLIASRIGIEPESLSRALARLTDQGILGPGPDLTVENPQALRAACAAGPRL
ncbi:Crp/Fnr family transcriptional regulator [Rhodospirillum rubrum]|uniref:Crp/Fnr family transcriptional regulator n=1 Tax=Rhodospirillum rubrum TaxID=1085 RepID=UPI001903F6D3|nr:Crp/Fnr family transcriptional regulator [Rhodospirillum rubrum]MBK1665326.1 Crp/Fnr family transcriptional regulator [Rhodospirillum rubrum]MBK1676514.1 Crp/Fnr family transcriptional regulator [Rhodospirillum rubrum]